MSDQTRPTYDALSRTDFSGDFMDLIRCQGFGPPVGIAGDASQIPHIEGTTVLAMRYADGVLTAGDRRATAGTTVMYDRADKVLEVDESCVMAISGSPAFAYEMARVLEFSFRYYRRSQLQELSLEGKLRTLSRLVRDNLPSALQGIGMVLPLFAAYDHAGSIGRIYFYDALGMQFEMTEFAVAGSGSVWIRGALYYENRWGRCLAELNQREATAIALRMLDAAATYDVATGGITRVTDVLPTIKCVTADGIETLHDDMIRDIHAESVEVNRAG